MDNLTRLRALLRRTLEQDGGHGGQDLYDALQLGAFALRRAGTVPEKSAAERKEIESGKTTVRGKQLAINADFARQVLFLSDQLLVSEHVCASILYDVTSALPNATPVESVEAAVNELHRRRRHTADALLLLLQAARAAEEAGAPPVYKRLDIFVRRELLADKPGQDSLALAVLAQIEATGQTLAKAQAARTAAVSATIIPTTTGGPGNLGHDALDARCKSLQRERRTLSGTLYLIARLGGLGGAEVKKLVDWLHDNPRHPSTYHVLSATLTALQPIAPPSNPLSTSTSASASSDRRTTLLADRTLAAHMRSTLAPAARWSEPGLKAALSLQWALFATDARHRDATGALEHVQGYTTEEVEALVWAGAQGDAFPYLARLIRRVAPTSVSTDGADELAMPVEAEQPSQEPELESPAQEFVPAFLDALDVLVRSLIRHASSELRKIKQRQEDVVLATARADRSTRFGRSGGPSSVAAPPAHADGPPRNDIATLFSLIGELYSALPAERALQFWGASPLASAADPTKDALAYAVALEGGTPRLPAFLQWSAWSTHATDADTLGALYGMLAGLAHGQHCAELAYNFVAHGAGENIVGSGGGAAPAVSWSAIFDLLESWASALSAPKPQQPAQITSGFGASLSRPQAPQQAPLILGPREVILARSFLRFLASVVTYSIDVRKAIAGHGSFRAIPTLVTLLPLGVPLELKGALFDALAAFCAPGAGPAGVDICRAVWGLMERMEVISLRPGPGAAGVRGVEVELDEVEAVHKLYPATIPFLRLLSTLIHTPKRVRLRERVLDSASLNTIPDALGTPYRAPGIGPFVAFVVEAVFAQIAQREYAHPTDRWRMNDLCLCFVERCLAAYDLSALLTVAESTPLTAELIQPYATHPGCDVLKRILSNTPLQNLLLAYVVDGIDGFERGFGTEEPFFHSTLVRVLRIVHRVLEIQDAFLDVLVPILCELDRTGAAVPRTSFTPLDQALSFAPQYVPALAAYVTFPAHQELVLLSVKILSQLARSPAFPNLATLLERSADSERILQGYIRIMQADSLQDIAEAEALAEDHTGAGAPDVDDALDLSQVTQLAALDILLENTTQNRPHPNVVHFLLFGNSRARQIENPQALNAQLTCIHVLLDSLMVGVPRLGRNGLDDDGSEDGEPLFVALPALAERLMRVIHQLCTHPHTADFVARYLRSREDFFARQVAAIPAQAPSMPSEPFIELVYADGARALTTAPALSAFIRYRSLALNLAALDLHTQTTRGHNRDVGELMQLLFTLDSDDGPGTGAPTDELALVDDAFRPFRALGQSHLRIIELAHALDFDWIDSLSVAPVELKFLAGLNLQSCTRRDASGCEIVDQGILLALLTNARRTLQTQGRIGSQADADQLTAEVGYVLESCALENHRREVAHAVATGFEAWRRVLDVALFKAFDRLAPGDRENVLFDVLHVLPRLIRSEHVQPPTRVLLAEAVVSVITKLREDRKEQVVSRAAHGNSSADALPVERLHALLRNLVECLLDSRQGELVRGNLYAALIDYLHLTNVTPIPAELPTDPLSASALVRSTLDRAVTLAGSGSQALQKGSLAILKETFGRLVAVVARDALDGAEVWRTVAFMLLDALVELAGAESSNAVLTTLAKSGMLGNFVQAIRRDDARLQGMLLPNPDDMNALYVYEAQMSLLVRVAQSRQGADRLQELQILPILSQAQFIGSRPEGLSSPDENGDFVPPALSRYHQLLMPALQLVGSVLGSLGPTHVTAGNQALDFFISHRDTIAVLLKDNSEPTSLIALREVHMIVHICSMLLPRVARNELASSITGFGAIHAAILGLASAALKGGLSTNGFHPQTESEYVDAQNHDLDGSSSKFDVAVQTAKSALHQALAAYLGAASDFTEPEIRLVLSPETSQREDRTSRYAGIPSVVDAVHALEEVGRRLSGTFMRLAELSAELSSDFRARDDLLLSQPQALVRELDVQQRMALASTQLSKLHMRTLAEAKTLTNTLETFLLLLWRHLIVYVEREEGISLSVPTSFSQSTRGVVNYNKNSFQNEVARQLLGAFHHLDTIHMDEYDPTWRSHATYITIMTERLREAIGFPQIPV